MCMHPQSYIHISLSHTLHTYMCFTFTIQVYVDRGPSFLRVNFWAVLIVTYLDKHTQTHWMHLSRQGRESFIFPFIIILCYLKDKILYQPRLASNSWSSVSPSPLFPLSLFLLCFVWWFWFWIFEIVFLCLALAVLKLSHPPASASSWVARVKGLSHYAQASVFVLKSCTQRDY